MCLLLAIVGLVWRRRAVLLGCLRMPWKVLSTSEVILRCHDDFYDLDVGL